MQNNRGIRIGIMAGGLLLLIALILAARGSSAGINRLYSVPNTMMAAVAYKPNEVAFSDGRIFKAYDYQTGKVTALSESYSTIDLQNISNLSISSDKNFMLFHNSLAQHGVLYNTLNKDNLDPTLDYWWVYNITAKEFTPLPQGVLQAKLDGDKVYALSFDNSNETLSTYTVNGLQAVSSFKVPNCSDFFVGKDRIYLQMADNSIWATKDGSVSNQDYINTQFIGLSTDKNYAFGVMGKAPNRELQEINLQDQTSKTVANNVVDTPSQMGDDVLYATNVRTIESKPSTFAVYSLATHKSTTWHFSGDINTIKTPLIPALLVGDNVAVVTDTSSNYYLVGRNIAQPGTL